MLSQTERLFTEATFHMTPDRFNPSLQWNLVSGFEISIPELPSRIFALLRHNNLYQVGVVLPSNTFYDNYQIYNHEYIEGETVDIGWVDMHSVLFFSPGVIETKTQQILHTKGKVVTQNSTHVLFEIVDWSDHPNYRNSEYIRSHKYKSIPKSYIKFMNGIEADLVSVKPEIDPEYLNESSGLISKVLLHERKHDFKNVSICGFLEKLKGDEPQNLLWSLIYNLRNRSYYLCHLNHPVGETIDTKNLYFDNSLKRNLLQKDQK